MACAEGGVLMACAAYMIWHVHGPGQGARRAACARTRSWAWRPRHVIGPRTRTNPPGGKWGWRQAPPSAIPSDSSHLEGHGLAPASSKSVAVGCSWSATSRGRWANRCQGRSEALAGRSSIAETASMEEHLCAVAHGPAVPKSTGCKHWEAISVHTCACVVQYKWVELGRVW